MTTTEERLRILKMIEEGTITAEEGAGLLSAVAESASKKKPARGDAVPPRWFRVRVTDRRGALLCRRAGSACESPIFSRASTKSTSTSP